MNTRAYPPPESTREKGPLLLLVGALAVLGALVPAAMWLDDGIDAERALYADRQAVASLQNLGVAAGLEPVDTRLGPGDTLELATKSFTTSPGVTVLVRRKDAVGAEGDPIWGYCVRALDEEGRKTRWLCHDAEHPPATPSGDPLADL